MSTSEKNPETPVDDKPFSSIPKEELRESLKAFNKNIEESIRRTEKQIRIAKVIRTIFMFAMAVYMALVLALLLRLQ